MQEIIKNIKDFLIRPTRYLLRGRIQADADKPARLTADSVVSFDSVPRRLWLRFDSLAEYETHRDELTDIFKESDGKDTVTIYCVAEKTENSASTESVREGDIRPALYS